ncbi:MAG: holo-ACP synthase [Acidaminococcaceae bacterium]
MIIGIGCDLVEVDRIARALARPQFAARVYTTEEIAYCTSCGQQQYMSFAARFAAKEALMKALGTGLRGGKLQDICLTKDDLGQPRLTLTGAWQELARSKGCTKIHVTLSHVKAYALAQVVLEGENQ